MGIEERERSDPAAAEIQMGLEEMKMIFRKEIVWRPLWLLSLSASARSPSEFAFAK